MDKLEQFFIRTVESAQEENQATSGAVNTGQISGFLQEKKPKKEPEKGVLAELVAAPVESEIVETVVASKPAAAQSLDSTPKKDLLDKLTKPAADHGITEAAKADTTTEIVETVEVEKAGGSDVNNDLLNKLINKGDGSTDSVEGSENG
jgi:hypothetical protein